MSGSVFLNNLDDFIAPSQACVNPLVSSKLLQPMVSSQETGGLTLGAAATKGPRVVLMNDTSTSDFDASIPHPIASLQPDLIKTKVSDNKKRVATVSLNDCLACSGCVTSAETVLIQEQSYRRLLDKIDSSNRVSDSDNKLIIVVAISPNSRASIAHFLDMDASECFLRIASVLKSLGVTYVVDAAAAGDVALMEAREEFVKRYEQGRSKAWERPACTAAVSSTSIAVFGATADITATPVLVGPAVLPHIQLPVLSSHCPGWVCYVEKSQPQAIPFLSTVKSAQQIMGTVVKHCLGGEEVYFVSVQPCFDKKLEASRLDFFHSEAPHSEVDLVLSTGELWSLLEGCSIEEESRGDDDAAAVMMSLHEEEEVESAGGGRVGSRSVGEYLASFEPDRPKGRDEYEGMLRCYSDDGLSFVNATDSNSGSGGYAEYLFKYAAERLHKVDLWGLKKQLPYKVGRNPDVAEVDLSHFTAAAAADDIHGVGGARMLKFGRAYGFRNIQSVLLKMRRGVCDLDYVEVMACPGGCNNGGGQIRAAAHSSSHSPHEAFVGSSSSSKSSSSYIEPMSEARDRLAGVEAEFHTRLQVRRIEDSPLVQFVYGPGFAQQPMSDAARSLLHTRYHAVPKMEILAPLATKW